MSEPWPMIAGIGAGIAAAAAVGQMKVSAVALGQQADDNETKREVAVLQQRLEHLQAELRQHGYLGSEEGPQANMARQYAAQVQTVWQLKDLEESLEDRVHGITAKSTSSGRNSFNRYMENQGKRFLGY